MEVAFTALGLCLVAVLLFIAVRAKFGLRVYRTKSGLALVFLSRDEDGEPIRVLRVGGANQSATYTEDRWSVPFGSYIAKYDYMYNVTVPVRDVLMVGGGGFSYPKYALVSNPDLHMDVVEYDEQVIRIARRHFGLDRLEAGCSCGSEPRLEVCCAEGRAFLDSCEKRYDAILNDTFQGAAPAATLGTVEAARCIHAHLNPGGVYISNVIGALRGEHSAYLQRVVVSLREVFAHVYVIRCIPVGLDEPSNNLVIATDGDGRWNAAVDFEPAFGIQPLRD